MMKINVKLIAVAMIAASTAGCGLVIDRNANFRRNFLSSPDVPASTAKMISNGELAKGMTKDEVQAAWGEPTARSLTNYGTRWF